MMKTIILLTFFNFSIQASIENQALFKIRSELKRFVSQKDGKLSQLLLNHAISPEFIQKILNQNKSNWEIKKRKNHRHSFPSQVEFTKFKVHNPEDNFLGDDLYFYFVISDGRLVHSKVTDFYRGLHAGDEIYLNAQDRLLYPFKGPIKISIDYGVIESDHENRDQMRRLTSLSAEIVYEILEGILDSNQGLEILRSVALKLSEIFSSLDSDDHLVQSSLPLNQPNIKRIHSGRHFWSDWKYQLYFKTWSEKISPQDK